MLVGRNKKQSEEGKTVAHNILSNSVTNNIIAFMAASVSVFSFHQLALVLKNFLGIVVVLQSQNHASRGRQERGWPIWH